MTRGARMSLDLLSLAQVALGAFTGGMAGFLAGRHSDDPRYWLPLLMIATISFVGNVLASVPLNPVPLIIGVPGLLGCVLFGIVGMEIGLWTAGSGKAKVARRR
jgi:hypothetical protein